MESHAEYRLMQPPLKVAGPADMYEPLTNDDIASQACQHLIQILALMNPRSPTPERT